MCFHTGFKMDESTRLFGNLLIVIWLVKRGVRPVQSQVHKSEEHLFRTSFRTEDQSIKQGVCVAGPRDLKQWSRANYVDAVLLSQ